MRHVEDHKDQSTMENGLLTFEIAYYLIHKSFIKVGTAQNLGERLVRSGPLDATRYSLTSLCRE